jgi:predicted nucleic acid-binding protein
METIDLALMDCSVLIPALREGGGQVEKKRVSRLLCEGRAALTESILLELWRGARPGVEQKHVARLAADLPVLQTTEGVWSKCYELARRGRAKGYHIPMGDLLVGACAWEYGVVVEQNDAHFEQIQALLGNEAIILMS